MSFPFLVYIHNTHITLDIQMNQINWILFAEAEAHGHYVNVALKPDPRCLLSSVLDIYGHLRSVIKQ